MGIRSPRYRIITDANDPLATALDSTVRCVAISRSLMSDPASKRRVISRWPFCCAASIEAGSMGSREITQVLLRRWARIVDGFFMIEFVSLCMSLHGDEVETSRDFYLEDFWGF